MNEVRSATPGIVVADAIEQLQKRHAVGAALHSSQHVAAGMLQRHVHIFRQARVCGNGIEQPLRHAVRIAVEGSHPLQAFDARQPFEQQRQAVAQSKVFPVRCGVLADQRHFADPGGRQAFRFAHD